MVLFAKNSERIAPCSDAEMNTDKKVE